MARDERRSADRSVLAEITAIAADFEAAVANPESETFQSLLERTEIARSGNLDASESATLDYVSANILAEIRRLSSPPDGRSAGWLDERTEGVLRRLRRALRDEVFDEVPAGRLIQLLTNLGNQLSSLGRYVEAIEMYDRA